MEPDSPTSSSRPTHTVRHYLVVRPLGAHPRQFEDRVEALVAATGVESFTLRQKLAGTALEVFAGGEDLLSLRATAAALGRGGVAACVVAKAGIDRGAQPLRCTRVEFRPDALHFVAPDGRRVASLNRGDRCLLVVAGLDVRRLQTKLLAKQAARRAPGLTPDECLALAVRNDPVLDLYLPESEAPVRIHGRRFDFTCLGERNRLAVGTNFPQVLDDIRDRAGPLVLDTGFGQKLYPFLSWPEPYDPAAMLEPFERYSRFVLRSWQAGLFGPFPGAAGATASPLAALGPLDPGGLLGTAAPGLGLGGQPQAEAAPTSRIALEPEPEPLPSPPPGTLSAFAVQNPRTWAGLVARALQGYRHWVRSLGAAPVIQPLVLAALAALGVAVAAEQPPAMAVSGWLFGAAACVHAFVLLRRRRAIQNCPTARLRSLPMGEVETTGTAEPKYTLRAPFTQTDCVYFSYEVYVRARHGDKQGYILREAGNSGRVPFYLADGEHRVLVHPERAVLSAGTADTLHGSGLGLLTLHLGRPVPADGKVVERVIPVGQRLYVMGYAQRLSRSEHDRRQLLQAKLRQVKSDPVRMARFDTDGDGRIDAGEWEQARTAVEEEALLEALDAPAARDEVAIGEHPAGGLFYISDRREEAILASLAWRAPLAFALGVAAMLGSGYALTRLLG